MRPWLSLVVLVVSAQALLAAQGTTPPRQLRVERSPMVLLASGVSYDGVALDRLSPERLAKLYSDDFWTEARADGVVFFKS